MCGNIGRWIYIYSRKIICSPNITTAMDKRYRRGCTRCLRTARTTSKNVMVRQDAKKGNCTH